MSVIRKLLGFPVVLLVVFGGTVGIGRAIGPTDLAPARAGDLAYLHVHPERTPGDGKAEAGPHVVFYTTVPSPDRYHLYLDFKHEGVVRTAAFTVTGLGSASPDVPAEDGADDAHSGDAH